MQLYKVPGSGAWVIYGDVQGYLMTRTYYFYTKREAIRLWKAEAAK